MCRRGLLPLRLQVDLFLASEYLAGAVHHLPQESVVLVSLQTFHSSLCLFCYVAVLLSVAYFLLGHQ
jgi:hypothetical protein